MYNENAYLLSSFVYDIILKYNSIMIILIMYFIYIDHNVLYLFLFRKISSTITRHIFQVMEEFIDKPHYNCSHF